jgi:hypothetical protein
MSILTTGTFINHKTGKIIENHTTILDLTEVNSSASLGIGIINTTAETRGIYIHNIKYDYKYSLSIGASIGKKIGGKSYFIPQIGYELKSNWKGVKQDE